MVKLATAREARLYGPALAARRWEYINAGVYVFAALLLVLALSASSSGARAGLAVAAVALAAVAAVNAHDLAAHLAGVDCRVGLARYDAQLGLVEFLVPAVHAAGCALAVVGLALLVSQSQHEQGKGGPGHVGRREAHAATMLLVAALLWVLGSVLNSCQVYERADGRAQLLQSSVQVPQLLGSLLFLVAAALNRRRLVVSGTGSAEEPAWLCLALAGSVLWLAAAMLNVLKVFTMHQSDAPRLEKLRGGAQEWLSRDREGRVPLNWEAGAAHRAPVILARRP
ncbi:hypothetical protein BDA96_09G265300 [Sorghum bicolor]|uniref:Uncharacterized protein n=2 Tax=Sorghum bicolor TaxID=4558 RepID=A0A1B6PAA0_SORBI|nr:uncharacterized protein LOC8066538 [Sorghum bicolor]KAG0519450.1 hypothetical protein BDA96_09G265300 [Sorghum bicolor]KXG22640.1 hypothetical protein SORBI_3009G250500 [Sorghum bicolor]|eukprot:XP_002440352.2 uncharacterized protein LOC8066538 [Sorghum bicolor]